MFVFISNSPVDGIKWYAELLQQLEQRFSGFTIYETSCWQKQLFMDISPSILDYCTKFPVEKLNGISLKLPKYI